MSDEETYVVVQQATYMHDVWGPFTKEEAIAFADAQAAHREEDGHHEYAVYRITPDGGLSRDALHRSQKRPGEYRPGALRDASERCGKGVHFFWKRR